MGMGMGMGMAFGAVPPDLGFKPLTLAFNLGPFGEPEFVEASLADGDPAYWSKTPFEPGLFALTLLPEFLDHRDPYRWTEIPIAEEALAWVGNPDRTRAEIEHLFQLMADQRERYMGEIVAQHDGAPLHWIALMGLQGGARPNTLRVLHLALRIGEFAAMHYKRRYDRARPSTVAPGLSPPFGPPNHPAFPSGHATQAWLMSRLLGLVNGHYEPYLDKLAERVALNRERGGFHYASDSLGGRSIAEGCTAIIRNIVGDTLAALPASHGDIGAPPPKPEVTDIRTLFQAARLEWWPAPR